jgi:hypothetical protein
MLLIIALFDHLGLRRDLNPPQAVSIFHIL